MSSFSFYISSSQVDILEHNRDGPGWFRYSLERARRFNPSARIDRSSLAAAQGRHPIDFLNLRARYNGERVTIKLWKCIIPRRIMYALHALLSYCFFLGDGSKISRSSCQIDCFDMCSKSDAGYGLEEEEPLVLLGNGTIVLKKGWLNFNLDK